MKEETTTPTNAPMSWSGSFPQNYEYNLKFVFGPYADDLTGRIDPQQTGKVLELACGTGQVTQRIAERFDERMELTATDLSPDMMAIAKTKITAAGISWAIADMCAIPYPDEHFDLVICQFGVMFAPDKPKAFGEVYRVLKNGGKLLFNTWGLIANNKVFQIFNQTLINVINFDLGAAEQGPFSMQNEKEVLQLLTGAGFNSLKAEAVFGTGESPTAAQAAKGFLQGNQLAVNLKEKNPALVEELQETIAQEFIKQLGDSPMKAPLQAWVFEALK